MDLRRVRGLNAIIDLRRSGTRRSCGRCGVGRACRRDVEDPGDDALQRGEDGVHPEASDEDSADADSAT